MPLRNGYFNSEAQRMKAVATFPSSQCQNSAQLILCEPE